MKINTFDKLALYLSSICSYLAIYNRRTDIVSRTTEALIGKAIKVIYSVNITKYNSLNGVVE